MSAPATDPADGHLRRLSGDLRPGPGQPALGRRRARVPRLPVGPGRHLARPRPPRRGRRPLRPGPHPAARLQPVRHRAPAGGGRHPRPPDRRRTRAGCSSATAGPRPTSAPSSWPDGGAAGAGTWSSAPTARSTAAPWPPCTPPASRPSTSRSSRCRRASATWPGGTSTPWRRPSTRAWRRVLLEPVQGEGGVNPAGARVLPGGAAASATNEGCLLIVDEVQTGLGRTGRMVRVPALRRSDPTWSRWPRPWATACRSVPAGPATTWPRPSCPGDHATTFGGQPLAAAAARAVLAVMEAEDVPARARAAGAYLTAAPGEAPRGRVACGARGCWSPPNWQRAKDAGLGRGRRPRCRSGRQRGHPDAPCGWPRHCW